MDSNENIKKEVIRLQQSAARQEAIDAKLNELVDLLANSDIDSEKIKDIRLRVNDALDNTKSHREQIAAFQHINTNEHASRADMLDEFSILLSNNQIDSNISKKYLRGERLSKFFLILISLVMIALGFAMIIMPAPPYFEMFTIYYFSPDDGVTLMDLISLLIILSGIFLLIRSIYKKASPES